MAHHFNLKLDRNLHQRLSSYCGVTGVKSQVAVKGLLLALQHPPQAPSHTVVRLALDEELHRRALAHCAVSGQTLTDLFRKGLDLFLTQASIDTIRR